MRRPDSTRGLVDALVADLAPVKLFPRLGAALAGIGVVWLFAALGAAAVVGPPYDLPTRVAASPWLALVVIGLATAAGAGVVAALASVLPDRDGLARVTRRAGAAGLGLAVAVGAGATVLGPGTSTPLVHDVACFGLGATVGLAPFVGVVVLARRGAVATPVRSAGWALLGGFALGGLAIQLVCHYPGARHLLLGHVGVPIGLLVVGVVPLTAWLGRARRTPDPLD